MIKLNRKAATELAVNSLVVIVLAIVILGLGLVFMTGTFTKVSSKFEEQVGREPEPMAADADNPVTLSRETIKTGSGETEVIKVNVYNPTNKDWIFNDIEISVDEEYEERVSLKIECSGGLDIEKITQPKKVSIGEQKQFTALLKIGVGAQKGPYLCKLGVERSEGLEKYEKDLTIEI